ncbi:hypothetical protein E2C01_065459 [Portunus trituberculatus]|uniref:Uncharacterized protein n=1 Tax=Portunus trituberculatus TaxID=210409 RepID=A0A5B7HPM5_PORTR|nr:hypothetical protein [Portunus trituberculatus]
MRSCPLASVRHPPGSSPATTCANRYYPTTVRLEGLAGSGGSRRLMAPQCTHSSELLLEEDPRVHLPASRLGSCAGISSLQETFAGYMGENYTCRAAIQRPQGQMCESGKEQQDRATRCKRKEPSKGLSSNSPLANSFLRRVSVMFEGETDLKRFGLPQFDNNVW